jgi:hypothetical protein
VARRAACFRLVHPQRHRASNEARLVQHVRYRGTAMRVDGFTKKLARLD